MLNKLLIFEKVPPVKLGLLSKNSEKNLSRESVSAIIGASIEKIINNERLGSSELSLIIKFYDKIELKEKEQVKFYFDKHLGKNEEEDFALLDAFDELHPISFVKSFFESEFIFKKLNPNQVKSFSRILTNTPTSELKGEEIIPFIEDLKITRTNGFTPGQIRYGLPYLKEGDFGFYFENKFDQLVGFCNNLLLEAPGGIARFLDIQAGKKLLKDSNAIKAKIKNESFGYFKYMNYIQKNNLAVINFPNYLKLRDIFVNLNNAIQVLSAKEHKRGAFWNSALELIDGLEIQTSSSSSSYDVGVAFYAGNFVICDFGPTGNAMYVYERNIFDKNVKINRDWKQKEYTTKSLTSLILNKRTQNKGTLSKGTLSHIGSWEDDVRELIRKARQ